MKYVIKTAHNPCDVALWQALYIDGVKEVEASCVDEKALICAYEIDEPFVHTRALAIHDCLTALFPPREDFRYLLDYLPLRVGQTVFTPTGTVEVAEVWETYRPSDYYTVTEFVLVNNELIDMPSTRFYSGHTVTEFKVKGSDAVWVWEDGLNEHQSIFFAHLEAIKIQA